MRASREVKMSWKCRKKRGGLKKCARVQVKRPRRTPHGSEERERLHYYLKLLESASQSALKLKAL